MAITARVLIDKMKEMPPDAEVIIRLGFLEPHHLRQIEQVSISHWHGDSDKGKDRVEIQTNNHREPPF